MSAASAVAAGRAAAEALMVDEVTIDRATGATTLDPVTLAEVPVFAPVYSGPARIQRTNSLSPSDTVVGGFEFTTSAFLAQLPLSASGIRKGDRLTVTAIASADADLLGLVGTVRGNLTKTHPTKRTLVCEEVG